MWEELKYYLSPPSKAPLKKKQHMPEQPYKTGKIIEILKQVKYFKDQEQKYGAEILRYYIPMLECSSLTDSSILLQQEGVYYIIMDGILKCQMYEDQSLKRNMQLSFRESIKIDIFTDGMKLDNQKKMYNRISAQSHTKFIKVYIKHPKFSKQAKKLGIKQKQRETRFRQMQRIITGDPDKILLMKQLQKIQIFKNLSQYDLASIIYESQFVRYPKGVITHFYGDEVTKIRVILNGSLKLTYTSELGKNNEKDPGKILLKKYLIHQNRLKSHDETTINSTMQKQDFIGLQQFLWNQEYTSKGEVLSVEIQLAEIPIKQFSHIFNEITNYATMNRIRGLIESKKAIINRTLEARQKQQEDIRFSINKNTKIRQLISSNKLVAANDKLTLRKNMQTLDINSLFPDRVIHKVAAKNNDEKFASLPKIKQRVNFFPEMYQKAIVPTELKDKLNYAKEKYQKKNSILLRKQSHYKQPGLSPEKVYEHVLINNLDEIQEKQFLSKHRYNQISNKRIRIQSWHQLRNSSEQRLNSSFNSNTQLQNSRKSIFNNFKVKKDRSPSNRYQTLQIL